MEVLKKKKSNYGFSCHRPQGRDMLYSSYTVMDNAMFPPPPELPHSLPGLPHMCRLAPPGRLRTDFLCWAHFLSCVCPNPLLVIHFSSDICFI